MLIDLTGRRFGRLYVIQRTAAPRGRAEAAWLCRCDCGGVSVVLGGNLRKDSGTRSCGCLNREAAPNRTHGFSRHRIYVSWSSMLQRCRNPRNSAYARYGAAGIDVCEEWNLFETFYKDMGPSYEEGLTLDRKENSKGYFKENCRWTTYAEQNRNRGVTVKVLTPLGEMTVAELSEVSGRAAKTVRKWIKAGTLFSRMGWKE